MYFSVFVLFEEMFLIFVLNGDGVGDFIKFVVSKVLFGLWFYLVDYFFDILVWFMVVEIICEKLILCLYDEFLYVLIVEIIFWEE